MRKKLFGKYSKFESILSTTIFFFLCYFNWLFFTGRLVENQISPPIMLMVFFIDLVCLAIIALPYLTKTLEKMSEKKTIEFLDLPNKNEKLTFTKISGFLSDQALASFLMTVLIFTGKSVFANYGAFVTAIYTFFLFSAANMIGTISLIRFIMHFSKYHRFLYALSSVISLSVMFAFFQVGIKMAP